MRHTDKSDLMHALLNYNSETTEKKKKRNEGTNDQCHSKVRKIRESEVSEGQQEDTSSNQDEEKDRDEPIDEENDEELAGNGDDKVDEEISKDHHLIVNGSALLHKFFWFGKTFGDIVRAYWFYVKTSFAVCAVSFDEYENNSTKDH